MSNKNSNKALREMVSNFLFGEDVGQPSQAAFVAKSDSVSVGGNTLMSGDHFSVAYNYDAGSATVYLGMPADIDWSTSGNGSISIADLQALVDAQSVGATDAAPAPEGM